MSYVPALLLVVLVVALAAACIGTVAALATDRWRLAVGGCLVIFTIVAVVLA